MKFSGLSEDIGKMSDLDVNAYGKPTHPDEYGHRTGCPPPGPTADVLLDTAAEAIAAVSHKLVDQKKTINLKVVEFFYHFHLA